MALHKRVFLTGANGFLGRAILEHLLQAGYSITLGGRSAPAGWGKDFLAFDLENPVSVRQAFAGSGEFDIVIHAAGTLLKNCLSVNFGGTRSLLSEVGPRARLWIQISSAGVYRNDFRSVVNEATTCEQLTEYEKSKWLADQEVVKSHASHVIIRPTMVAGIGMKGSPLRLFAKAVSSGFVPAFDNDACLNMVHVQDVAAAVLHFCQRSLPEGSGREFILSDDLFLSEVIEIIERTFHKSGSCTRIPDFILKTAAGLGSALGISSFNRRRYAVLNNKARFASLGFCLIAPGWPACGSRSAVEQFCVALRRKALS